MEPTTTTKKGSSLVIIVVILLIIIIGAMVTMRSKTEAPVDTTTPYGVSGNTDTTNQISTEKSELTAEVNSAVNFDNESSLQEIDKEFQ